MKLFKKKRTNRIFSLIIAIVMVISAVNMTVMPAAADEDAVEVSGAEIPTAYSQGGGSGLRCEYNHQHRR